MTSRWRYGLVIVRRSVPRKGVDFYDQMPRDFRSVLRSALSLLPIDAPVRFTLLASIGNVRPLAFR
jgi:hypothetical protein